MNPIRKKAPRFLKATALKRRLFFFMSDGFLIALSISLSFWIRFNGAIPTSYLRNLPYFIGLALLLKLACLTLVNLYDISWRFVGLEDLIKVFQALAMGSLALGMALYLLRTTGPFKITAFPRSVLLIDFILSLILVGSLRISKRVALHGFRGVLKSRDARANTLIVGAGFSGAQIAREMLQNNNPYIPVGFIDDDPSQWKIKVHGIKVLGASRDIPRLVEEYSVEKILIALPDADSTEIRRIVGIVRETRIQDQIKILPSTLDLINGKASLSDLHDIQLNDLLGRAPVRIDFHVIQRFIQGRTVLITGAAGSIGSELTKTVLRFKPRSAVLVEIDETELFNLVNDLEENKTGIVPVVGDVRDEEKMAAIFAKYTPQIVLHAAAYKHVPILEYYPEEAVRTNIAGTRNIARAALRSGVERFIFISTDKAINPTSVMGATKRACEEMLKILDREGPTRFISVRFGNVLGSRGSVIPVFREQIKRGGPVTVTHPEMKRYFMMTSEAVLLVLEAAATGNGEDVFVLDMGEQIKIIDLAREIIRLSGYEPDKDIPIIYTGRRPGEKLSEEIFGAEEGVEHTEYEKLLKARSASPHPPKTLLNEIERLVETCGSEERDTLIQNLRKIVPTYIPYEAGQATISMTMKG